MSDFSRLRVEAIKLLQTKQNMMDRTYEEYSTERILEELYIHQIELEIQNDELRESEFALISVNQKYTELYNQAPNGYITINLQGEITEANQTILDILGIDFSLVKNKHLMKYIRKIDREKYILFLEKLFKTQTTQYTDIYLQPQSQEVLPVYIKGVVFRDRSDKIHSYLLAITDISEYKRIQDKLSKEKELAMVVRSINEGAIITSEAGIIQNFNPYLQQLLDIGSEEIIGLPLNQVLKIVNEDLTPKYPNLISQVMDFGKLEDQSNNTYLFHKEKLISINFSGTMYTQENGEIRLVFVLKDVSERVSISRDEMKAKNFDNIGILAGKIAHDFNNLFTSILLNLDFAQSLQKKDSELINEPLSEIGISITSGINLTKQLMSFAKGGKPKTKIMRIREMIFDQTKILLSGSNFNYTLKIDNNLWPVKVELERIRQVISNLILNARDAIAINGNISVIAMNVEVKFNDLTNHKHYVKIIVQDDGIGIRSELLDRVFTPYFTTKPGASGLGLALAYANVTQHEGKIGVKSFPNFGCVFTVYLPAYPEVQLLTTDETEQQGIKDQYTGRENQVYGPVLILDDDPQICKILEKIFRNLGVSVFITNNGSEAIKEYKGKLGTEGEYKILLLDLIMPNGIGGEITLNEIKELNPAVIAICMSGYSEKGILADYPKFGFRYALQKPFTTDEIIHAIEQSLRFYEEA